MAERVRECTVQQQPGHGSATVKVRERPAYQSIEEARADLDLHLMRGDTELAARAQAQAEIDRLHEASRITHAVANTEPTPQEAALLRAVELADGDGRNLNAREWVDRFKVLSPAHREMVDRWGAASQDNAEYFLAAMNVLPKAVRERFLSDDISVGLHAAFVEGVSALARRAGIVGFEPDGGMEQPAPRREGTPLGYLFGQRPPSPRQVLEELTARQADLMDRGDRAGAQALETEIMEAAAQAGGEEE